MKKLFQRTIYILIIILYIFALFISPSGMPLEGANSRKNISTDSSNQTKLKVKLFAEVLGVTKEYSLEKDVYSMHQYDDSQHKNYVFEEENVKELASVEPATYSYHQNTLNDKEVLGFLPYWSLAKYQEIDYSKFSTIAYFSLTNDSGGSWVSDAGYTAFNSATFSNMVNKAHSKGTKVVVVAKNFDPLSIRNIINNTNGAGDRLINRIVSAIRDKNLDGVNVDFEYVPKVSADTVNDSLRQKFADWHTRLADRVHTEFPKAHVSTDVFGSSGVGYSMYDMSALGDTPIDYIVMMTYDYIITSCYDGKKVAPMSPLFGNNLYGTPNWNISSHLTAGANKAGSKKIIMGVPYYGIDFQVKTSQKDSYNALVDYPNCDGTIETYGSIVDPKFDQYHNSGTLRWNNTEKARWYVYSVGGKWRHGYYDDPLSLAAKYDFVRSANLGGIGIWALGYDNNAKELNDVIRDKFQKAPFYIHFGYGVSLERINAILNANGVSITNSIGDSTFMVVPTSQVSGIIMNKLRLYKEVIDVRFEVDGITRNLNQ